MIAPTERVGYTDELIVVIRFSLGSAIAKELLLEHPERFNKAIIIATTTNGSNVAATMKAIPDTSPIGREIEATPHWKTPPGKFPFVANQVIIMVGTADSAAGIESSKVLATPIPGRGMAGSIQESNTPPDG